MKRLFVNILVIGMALMSFVGCDAFYSASTSDNSTGSPYEVVVVCDQQPWLSELGDTLQTILQQPVRELNNYEPMFNVMRVLPNNFKSLTRHHRNIIVIHVNSEFSEPKIEAQYDATAAPQIFISIQGPDNHTLAQYLSDNRDNLLYVLEKAERDRRVDYSHKYYSRPLHEMIQKEFGIDSELHFNSQAAVFGQATKEMYKLLCYQNAGTLNNLTVGAGDLYVTVYGGRTRLVGILLGRGYTIDEAKEELKGVTLESLVVAERVARAVIKASALGKLDLSDFPLLMHVNDILINKKPVDIPWEKFTFIE